VPVLRLNLGCGFKKLPGFVNVDKEPLCQPDVLWDLEAFPWPWETGSVEEVVASHSLEHLGASADVWIGIIRELWRVCRPGARIAIEVPHPRHQNFMHDPTHVRAITPVGLAMFSQARNLADLEAGGAETKLGLFNGVDFEVEQVGYDLCEPLLSDFLSGRKSQAEAEADLAQKNDMCVQIRILVRVVKPGRGERWIADRSRQESRSEYSGPV
jgi:hypothetical protein